MAVAIPESWLPACRSELTKPYFVELQAFVARERQQYDVFPPAEDVFNALALTPLPQVRVVLLGQDPYHDDGQAHGLCFSVRPGIRPPPSLRNIFKELNSDLGCPVPKHGDLTAWARQGVLLLNTVLTVRAHQPHSHRGRGWEQFTDHLIGTLNAGPRQLVFALWGRHAQQKKSLIDQGRHRTIEAAHPSPLSAGRGFFGSKPFSKINNALHSLGEPPIDWQLG